MEAIAALKNSNIAEIYAPSFSVFLELLEKNRTEIESIRRSTVQYGSTERHQLDIYFPPGQSESLPPILLFSYGGGLEVGDRVLSHAHGLVYTNVGAFFAKRGFLTVIADYRLASAGAVYPDASQDISDALEWIVANLDREGDVSRIFLYGHSAGSLNQSLLLCHPTLLRPEMRRRIKGAVFNGGAFRFEHKAVLVRVQSYFGYDGLHITNSPYGLLRAATNEFVANLPPILNIRAEHDPEFICAIVKDFQTLCEARKVRIKEYVNMGHNHISANLALSSGEGEQWAEDAIHWMREQY